MCTGRLLRHILPLIAQFIAVGFAAQAQTESSILSRAGSGTTGLRWLPCDGRHTGWFHSGIGSAQLSCDCGTELVGGTVTSLHHDPAPANARNTVTPV